MIVSSTVLGLIEPQPSRGCQLKREGDALFGQDRPLPFRQICSMKVGHARRRVERRGARLGIGAVPRAERAAQRGERLPIGVLARDVWSSHAIRRGVAASAVIIAVLHRGDR